MIIRADARSLPIPDESIDSVVCDPPYGLAFMGKDWDKVDYPWHFDWAEECLRVLKPGAHLVAFGGTRTVHRLACAIEDAGFEIRDTIAWLQWQGFPKSLDVSKAIDKHRPDEIRHICRWLRGAMDRVSKTSSEIAEVFGVHSRMVDHWAARDTDSQPTIPTLIQWGQLKLILGFGDEMDAEFERLNARKGKPSDTWIDAEILGEYDGQLPGLVGCRLTSRDNLKRAPSEPAARWQGWGTALKPAHEPAILARKPLIGTVAHNITEHGCGALNIDGCRYERGDSAWPGPQDGPTGPQCEYIQRGEPCPGHGDWRSQSGQTIHALPRHRPGEPSADRRYADNGSVDFAPTPGPRGGSDLGRYPANIYATPKAGRAEREAGCADLPAIAGHDAVDRKAGTAGLDNPRAGAGRTAESVRNNHPTVKPIALMRWLVRLVTPPGGVCLDPFVGSGTTLCAAAAEGIRAIGIEIDPDYARIAQARSRWWEKHGGAAMVEAKADAHDRASGQMGLF